MRHNRNKKPPKTFLSPSSTLLQFVADMLYNKFYHKSTTNRISGVGALQCIKSYYLSAPPRLEMSSGPGAIYINTKMVINHICVGTYIMEQYITPNYDNLRSYVQDKEAK